LRAQLDSCLRFVQNVAAHSAVIGRRARLWTDLRTLNPKDL
jgi:hypothetical protein